MSLGNLGRRFELGPVLIAAVCFAAGGCSDSTPSGRGQADAALGGSEATDTLCGDGVDNDGDGLKDCLDPDCAGHASCASTSSDSGGSVTFDGGIPQLDGGCGGQRYEAARNAANLLIVLDRSGSMVTNTVPGTTPEHSRWEVAKEAVVRVLDQNNGQIRFGLLLYPGYGKTCTGEACQVEPDPQIAIGDNTVGDIESYLPDVDTCSLRTPIAGALEAAGNYAGLADTTHANYVLLLTDGEQTSECTGDPGNVAAALASRTPPIKTFVVGFGGGVNTTQLGNIAEKGGTGSYYQADDAAGLQSAFDAIAGSVLTCSYTLSDDPPDPDDLGVYFDGEGVAPDATNGWTYQATGRLLEFHGDACTQIKSGSVTQLDVIFGCPVTLY